METIIITILILIYLMYKDYSYQKEMRLLFSLVLSNGKDTKQNASLLNKIFNKKEKNKLEEVDNPYIPLEEVPEKTIRESFEGSMKK